MDPNKNKVTKFFASILTLGIASGPAALEAQERDTEEEVFELSPFTVEGEDDVGYLSTSTLAGTRLRSDLRDVAASISVVTEEFLDDTGSTSLNELFVYTANTEAFGAGGNFSNDSGSQQADTAQERAEPQRATRIRGLDPADLTRNYFLTDIPFDSYNTDRVTINRGANNILFGLGSPSGIVNQSTARASLGENFGKIRFRVDEEGSFRTSLNYNKVLIDEKLAVRFAALRDERDFKQKPAFSDDERFYLAVTAKPWKGATVRANFEDGELEANRPNPVAPPEAISAWFSTQKFAGPNVERVVYDNWTSQGPGQADGSRAQWVPGQIQLPLGLGIDQVSALPRIQSDIGRLEDGNVHNTRGAFAFWPDPNQALPAYGSENRIRQQFQATDDPRTPEVDPAVPGFSSGFGIWKDEIGRQEFKVVRNIGRPMRRVADRNLDDLDALGLVLGEDVGPRFIDQGFVDTQVFDFTNNLISGGASFQDTDFDSQNLTIEQLFLDGKLGFEAAYDTQDYMVDFFAPFRSDKSQQVFIDINTALPTGVPNPNFGRPFVSAQPLRKTTRSTERESLRFTTFYNLDLESMLGDRVGDFWSQLLGDHTITGFYNDQEIESLTFDQDLQWGDPAFIRAINDNNANRAKLAAGANNVQAIMYIGDPVIDAPNFESVRVGRVGDNIKLWNPGGSVPNVRFWDPGPAPGNPSLSAVNDRGIPLLDEDGNVQDLGEAAILANGRTVERDVQMLAATKNALAERDEIESVAFIMQSKFFNDSIVTTLGYRDDTSDNFTNDSAVELPDGQDSLVGFDAQDGRFDSVGDETFSWSVVAHLPEQWAELPFGSELSFHLGESENFQAEAGSVDRFLDPIAAPSGETREYGFTLSMFDRKLYARVNWFKTSVNNSLVNTQVDNMVAGTLNKIDQWLDQADDMDVFAGGFDDPAVLQTLSQTSDIARKAATLLWENDAIFGDVVKANFGNPSSTFGDDGFLRDIDRDAIRTPAGMSDTQDLVSEGLEVEIVYNPTSSWTMLLNVSQQEAVRSNVAPRSDAFFQDFFGEAGTGIPGFSGLTLEDIPTSIFEGVGGGIRLFNPDINGFEAREDLGGNASLGNLWFARLQTINPFPEFLTLKSTEGAPQPEMREWRVNFVSNYQFADGRLRGLGLGGAVRWQDSAAVGFPTIRIDQGGNSIPIGDVNNPYTDGSQTNFDVWASYQVPLFQDQVDWKIQLNVQNVFGDDDGVIVTAVQPNGAPARVRFEPQRLAFLTNTFSF